ncbi:unnamed protein product [Urochloa decumbens]|uniref:NET domain-containing protein n=1 Tax=Urochloa decumbens TaxID=240449 RepID=A0ABC9CHM6_9POAL
MPRDPSASQSLPGTGGFCATKRKIVNSVQVEVEAIPIGLEKPVYPTPVHLRGGPSACVSSVPTQKRTKRARSSAESGAEALTAAGDPALDCVHKRMASELDALRELLKKAELISRGPACKSKRVLPAAEPPRPEPRTEAAGKTPSTKMRKVSPPPPPDQEQKQRKAPPRRMPLDERKQLAGRMASLATVPSQIAEFLQERLGGDGDQIEIDFHSAEDSVLFELHARLDKLAAEERPGADAVVPTEEQGSAATEVDSKTQTGNNLASDEVPEQQGEGDVDICGASDSDSGSSSSSSDSEGSSSSSDSSGSSSSSDSGSESDSDEECRASTVPEIVSGGGVGSTGTALPALLTEAPQSPAHSAEPKKKVQDAPRAAPKAVSITGVLYKAKLRRELLEMERAVVPDESIDERDLRHLHIAEYGRSGIMRQLKLFLKADA